MPYRRCGRSGLQLRDLARAWWNFGHDRPPETSRDRAAARPRRHPLDLANNYGPPYGSAEENFGRLLHHDRGRSATSWSSRARRPRHGQARRRVPRKYLLASLDQSLARLGLEYVDIFYSHRFDLETPLEETMGAPTLPCGRKALYAGISLLGGADARGRGDPPRPGTPPSFTSPRTHC
jgi:L-glyceraldehyde 3-phosphate reductase